MAMKMDMFRVLGVWVVVVAIAMVGCGKKPASEPIKTVGVVERTGAALDRAAEKTAEAVTNAAKKTTEAAKAAAAATKDVTGKAVEKTGEALGKAGNAVEDTGAGMQK